MAEVELITPDSGTETTADNQDTDITPEPSPIPENWKEWIPEDIRNTPVIQETKDITGMAKRLVDSQAMIGKSMRMPEDGDTAGWDEVYGKLGRPQAAIDYKIDPSITPEGAVNEKLQTSFLEAAHKIGLNNTQANALVSWNNEQLQSIYSIKDEQAKDAVSQLKHDWGNAFKERLAVTERVLTQFGEGEVSAAAVRDNPALIKLVYNMGKDLIEGQVSGDSGLGSMTMSPKEALDKINKLHRDSEFMKAYHEQKNPGHQGAMEEMTDLHKMAYPEEE